MRNRTHTAQPIFESHQAVDKGGLLFLLPSLIQQGLLKANDFYTFPPSDYYGVESIILTLAFMALGRIKNPESLKNCKPGELGRLIGLDRVPEVKCLRAKLESICEQEQASAFNEELMKEWCATQVEEEQGFYYVDGHQRIYYGASANLPKKYISRQKLCLSATTEFWVNDGQGLPLMMVIGELNEKLQDAILTLIIPQMLQADLLIPLDKYKDKDIPQCTFVFDREAYSPIFFDKLWDEYRISFITYRKNSSDNCSVDSFKEVTFNLMENEINMLLCECCVMLGEHKNWYREVRRLTPASGHQTAIITNHPTLSKEQIAQRMFSRWTQENFFKYLISDYDFDKVVSFGVEEVDLETEVVNPEYRKRTHQIKKQRDKIKRIEAKFYPIAEQLMNDDIEKIPKISIKYEDYRTKIEALKKELNHMLEERKQHKPKIKVKEMTEGFVYNKLKTESKKFMNVIRMIAYRAETAVANLLIDLTENKNIKQYRRMIVKYIINAPADIIPDYKNKILEVKLHHLSTPAHNQMAQKLTELLNETQTVFPSTDLVMRFKASES